MTATRARPRVRAAAALMAATAALASCAADDGSTAMTEPSASTSEPVPTPSPAPTGPTLQPPPTEVEDLPVPGPDGQVVTVTGTVSEGVEAGCLVLASGGTVYELIGSHDQLPVGARVTVEGTLITGLSTCMQGIPLRVRSVVVDSTVTG